MDARLRNLRNTGCFDRAVVYLDAGDSFEGHEDGEVLWAGTEAPERAWRRGLIQIAAAPVHLEWGFLARGFATLLDEARGKTAGCDGDPWGLDLPRLALYLAPRFGHADRVSAGHPRAAAAPAVLPRIHYVDGVVPDPLSVDEGED